MALMTDEEGRRAEAWWRLRAHLGLPLPAYCLNPVFIGIDLAADDSGGFTPANSMTGKTSRLVVVDEPVYGSTRETGAPRRSNNNSDDWR